MEWLVLVFLLNGDAIPGNFSCLAPFLNLLPYTERYKKHLNVAIYAFANSRNQTRAASAASECAIHCTIVSRLKLCFFLPLMIMD